MTVFLYTLKRLLKNKFQLAVMLILPLIVLIPTSLVSSNSVGISIGVADCDGTNFTKDLVTRLKINFAIMDIPANTADVQVENNNSTYAVVIPKGFTNDILNGKSPKIKGYCIKEKNCFSIVSAAVDGFVYPSKRIAAKVHGNKAAFYSAVKNIPKPSAEAQKKDGKTIYNLIMQFMLLSTVFSTSLIIMDKEKKMFFRSLNAPVTLRSYMLQSILCFFCFSVLQIGAMFGLVHCVFGVDAGKNPIGIVLVLLALALAGVALGVAISSLCKSTAQSVVIGIGLVLVMCMLGGAWGMMPNGAVMTGLSKFTPYYWASGAVGNLLDGKSLSSVAPDFAILFVFAAVFFLAGTWRKSDITR